MNIIYTFHFLNGISEINQLFDDILIIWQAPVYVHKVKRLKLMKQVLKKRQFPLIQFDMMEYAERI